MIGNFNNYHNFFTKITTPNYNRLTGCNIKKHLNFYKNDRPIVDVNSDVQMLVRNYFFDDISRDISKIKIKNIITKNNSVFIYGTYIFSDENENNLTQLQFSITMETIYNKTDIIDGICSDAYLYERGNSYKYYVDIYM